MTSQRKKEPAHCSLNGAAAASFKLEQYYSLTQFILQTLTHQLRKIINKPISFAIPYQGILLLNSRVFK